MEITGSVPSWSIPNTMTRKTIIGVMGAGDGATERDVTHAYALGALLAASGWIVLSGGRRAGVMDAVSRGAREAGGTTIGILPTSDASSVSDGVEIAIFTEMGQGRNNINVLSSAVVVACGMGAGTAAEVALAIKAGKPIILLDVKAEAASFFSSLGAREGVRVLLAGNPAQAVEFIKELLGAGESGKTTD